MSVTALAAFRIRPDRCAHDWHERKINRDGRMITRDVCRHCGVIRFERLSMPPQTPVAT